MLAGSGLAAPAQVSHDEFHFFVRTDGVGYTEQGYLRQVLLACGLYLQPSQVPDQGVESLVFRYDVKIAFLVLRRELADVIGNMEIQRIRSTPGNLNVLSVISQALHRLRQGERHLRLIFPDEHKHLERLLLQ